MDNLDRTRLALELREFQDKLATEDDPVERQNLEHGMREVLAQARGDAPPSAAPTRRGPSDGAPPPPPAKPSGPAGPPAGPPSAPPAAPPGPAPSRDPKGEDPYEEVREELNEIEDSVGEIRDLVEEHGDILHEMKMEDASPEEINEEVDKKKDKLKDNDVLTEREYGMGSESSFYASTEGVRPMSNLREARQRRLARGEKLAQSNAHGQQFPDREDITLEEDHWNSEGERDDHPANLDYVGDIPADTYYNGKELEERKKRERKQAPGWLSDTFAPTAEALKKISAICRTADEGAYWMLVRSDQDDAPIARIDCPENVDPQLFASKEFGTQLLTAIRKEGFAAAMEAYGAVPVEGQASSPNAAPEDGAMADARHDDEGRAGEMERRKNDNDGHVHTTAGDVPEQFKKKDDDDSCDDDDDDEKKAFVERAAQKLAGHMFQRFLRAYAIAAQACDRNMLAEGSPLKSALFRSLERMGVHDPTPLLERAFRVGGQKHYDTILNEAHRIMAMSDEALVEWEATVRRAATVMPDVADSGADMQRQAVADAMRLRASNGSATFTGDTDVLRSGESDLMSKYAAVAPKPDLFYRARGLPVPGAKPVAAGV